MSSNINIAVASKSHLLLKRLQPFRQSSPHHKSSVYFEGYRNDTETGVLPSDFSPVGDGGVPFRNVLQLLNADSQSHVGFNGHDGEGRKSPSGCPQSRRLKKAGWMATMWMSIAGCFGLIIHEGNHKTKHYLEVPAYQALVSVEKTLDEGQSHIPALSDRYHTSQVVKNQLMAHLNAIALFQPPENANVRSEQVDLFKRQQKSLIHSLDHMRYSDEDQREIEKLASKLEKISLDLHQNDESLTLQQLSQSMEFIYRDYADNILAKHLKPEQTDCYKRLAKEHIAHIEKEKKPTNSNLLYLGLVATALFSCYGHAKADSRK